MTWSLKTRTLSVERMLVMGVVNATPDSFSDGGAFLDPSGAIAHGRRLVNEGADIIDIGGESSRPGAEPVGLEEELARTIPVVERLAADGAVVSIDTTKSEVARVAIAAGAEIVNDITALSDPAMVSLCRREQPGVVLMHMRGTPRTMQADPRYDDVVEDVALFLAERAASVVEAGIDPSRICLDPGIGFGKTVDHNLALLAATARFVDLGYPVLVGASRKRFLGEILGRELPEERDAGTAGVAAVVATLGAAVFRAHNVPAVRDAALIATAIVRHG
ncbi:MAG: dihydropteroate synthase [Acidimicrobiia bacterium]|nr:dihydropteroate synthase [Acidimicrobiia bacterium]